jgi:hypothetical protein
MSKKKPAAKKKAPAKKSAAKKKAPAKKASAKKTALATRRTLTSAIARGVSKKTAAATIFLFKNENGFRIRTSPQLLTAPMGHIEWTVVNLVNDDEIDVEISWPEGGPWGADPIKINRGNERKSLADAKPGRYKYNVTANGYTEDPEIEFPDGN